VVENWRGRLKGIVCCVARAVVSAGGTCETRVYGAYLEIAGSPFDLYMVAIGMLMTLWMYDI